MAPESTLRGFDDALEHLDSRPDCRALGIIGPVPGDVPDLALLQGRRLLVCCEEGTRLRDLAEAGMNAGAEVEWLRTDKPDFDRLAAWALPVAGVVLAAGAASRMGSNKLLLDAGGQPLVCHVIEAASGGGCHHVIAVYAQKPVKDAIGNSAVCVENPQAASGQASSLRVGLTAVPEDMAGALVLLGDQPLVGARTIEVILRAWRREGARPAVATSYNGRREDWRPPVLLDRSLWPELMTLEGDAGARQLLEKRPELVDTVHSTGRPDDVDTPEDYAKIVHLFPGERSH
ncbi:MAG: nucleotidyltransferase family protein [Chloroflexi bacterium]|nr:MAG: nucleotidyltransferase family protein [Chloroflexota bacterium]